MVHGGGLADASEVFVGDGGGLWKCVTRLRLHDHAASTRTVVGIVLRAEKVKPGI